MTLGRRDASVGSKSGSTSWPSANIHHFSNPPQHTGACSRTIKQPTVAVAVADADLATVVVRPLQLLTPAGPAGTPQQPPHQLRHKQQQQQQQQEASDRKKRHQRPKQHQHVPQHHHVKNLHKLYSSEPKLLTNAIKKCTTWPQLQQLLGSAGAAANHIHLVAAVVHAAQLLDKQQQQQQQGAQHPQQQQQQEGASSQQQQQQQQQDDKGTAAACVTWVLSVTQQLLQQHGLNMEPRHTANLLWALARCCSSSSSSSSGYSTGDNLDGHLEASSSCTVSTGSNSCGGGKGLDDMGSIVRQLLQLQEQQWAAAVQCNHQQQQQQMIAGCPQLKPQDVTNSIWALATLQQKPSSSWVQLFQQLSIQVVAQCSFQELSNMIWAFAKLGLPVQQQWMDTFLNASGRRLDNLAGSASASSSSSSNSSSGSRSKQVEPAAATQALANIAYALGSIAKQQQQQQWQLNPGWCARYFQATQPLLQDFVVGQLSMTLWGVVAWCNCLPQQLQQQQQCVLPPVSWLEAYTAAVQQHLQDYTDQGIVNTAASCYQLLLQLQQQQDDDHQQDLLLLQQQLQQLLAVMLQAAAGRAQTLPVSAAAALAWASTGLGSSSSSSSSSSSDSGSSSSTLMQQQQQPGACNPLLLQYVAVHTATAASLGSSSSSRSSGDQVQLLWLCAKAQQLPSSAVWTRDMCQSLQQQLLDRSVGQIAQLTWSLGQLLQQYCQQQQQQQQQPGDSYVSDAADGSMQGVVAQLSRSALSVLHHVASSISSMTGLQLVETAVGAAHIATAWVSLHHQQQSQQQEQQQQQQEAVNAVTLAITTAATAILKQQQHHSSDRLRSQQFLALVGSIHTLLQHCPVTAAGSNSDVRQSLSSFLAAAAPQVAGGPSVLIVRLSLLLLAVAQVSARAAATAAAKDGSGPLLQRPHNAAVSPPPAAAAAAAAAAFTQAAVADAAVLPGSCSPVVQQALLDVLSAEWSQLLPDELLQAAWLSHRLNVHLSGAVLSDLLYTLQSHVSSYDPQQQLLLVLLLSKQWRYVPKTAVRARSALAGRLLAATQQLLLEAWQQQQGCHVSCSSSSSSSSKCSDAAYLSQLLSGLVQAHIRPPEAWLQLYCQLLLQQLPAITVDQLSKVMLGLGRVGFKADDKLAEVLLQRSEELLATADRQYLVRIMHAVGKLHLDPSDSWLDRFYVRVSDAPGRFGVSGFGMVVWGLARVGAKPSREWMQTLLDRTFGTSTQQQQQQQQRDGGSVVSKPEKQLKPQHLANIICAFAKLGFVPGPQWLSWFRAEVGQQTGALQDLDHFHIEWAWRELHEAEHCNNTIAGLGQ